MKANFGNCLKLTLAHEGGYVNHPKDPGGRTNMGIIQRTYDAYRKRLGHPLRSVAQIEVGEVHAIYRQDYWHPINGDKIPFGIDYTVFDAAVNSGIGQGPKWTQRALGVNADSRIGPTTLAAMTALDEAGLLKVIKNANARRLGFLKGLSHWSTFGRGWARRVAEVEAGSIGMVAGPHVLREEASKSKKVAAGEGAGTAGTVFSIETVTNMAEAGQIVTYVVWGVLAIIAVIAVKRGLAHMDRAATMNKVAGILEKILEN